MVRIEAYRAADDVEDEQPWNPEGRRQRHQSEDDGEPQARARNHGDNDRPADAAGRVLAPTGHRGRDALVPDAVRDASRHHVAGRRREVMHEMDTVARREDPAKLTPRPG